MGEYTDVTRTSGLGVAHVPIRSPGNWIARLVHMIPAPNGEKGSDHDWESFFGTLTFRIPPESGFPLTVESIMRGPNLVGHGISQVRWAGDSSRLFFAWRRPGDSEFHTYELPRIGGTPRRLSRDEARAAPPALGTPQIPGPQGPPVLAGHYSRDRRRVVFAEEGDLIVQDTVTGTRRQLLRTVESESAPRFTRDEKHVTFLRQNNLFRLALEAGELEQLTDIRPGPERPEPKLTDSQRFLEAQQKELFETVRERLEEKETAESRRKERQKRQPYYLPARASVTAMELSPDGTVVLFAEAQRAEQAKGSIVPSFVTTTGYTEDLQARAKVGDQLGKQRMGILSVETGAVVWVDPGQKAGEEAKAGRRESKDAAGTAARGLEMRAGRGARRLRARSW